MSEIGVIGAGSWGMALSRMLANSGHKVEVWSALPNEIEDLISTRKQKNLPEMDIPVGVDFTKNIEEVCTAKDILLFAVPSVFVRTTVKKARPYIPDGQIIIDVAKGIEPDTLLTLTSVIKEELSIDEEHRNVKLVALSGPTPVSYTHLTLPTILLV